MFGASRRALAGAALLAVSASALAAGFSTQSGKIYDAAGHEVQVRGISHHGFQSEILQPQYLWAQGWKEQIAQIRALGFNAVRLPFAPDTLYNSTPVDQLSYVDPNRNADLLGKTPLQVLDLWMAEADRQGLYVMLDFHSVSKYRQYPTWFVNTPADYNLIYNKQAYTKDHWIRDLKFVAARYASNAHFFAIDLYNEPNGPVRWSTGDPNQANSAYYWKNAAEAAAAGVLAANPNLLIFVQGINGNFDGVENSNLAMNWGEDFQPQKYQPLNIPANKLVLTPHTYGPDVYVKSSFSAPNFPDNLPADWDTLFGQFYPDVMVVPGEWGGRYGNGGGGQMDVTWQNAFVKYLIGKGMRSSFFWCYTPNSGDTGGILDDDLNVRQDKLALVRSLWGGTTVSLSAPSYTVSQSSGSLRVTVNRGGDAASPVSVRYASADGTARAGSDYSPASGTLSWAAGEMTAKSFTVAISNAAPYQGSKTFAVNLSNPAGATIGPTTSATATINGSAAATPGSFAFAKSSYALNQTAGSISLVIARNGGTSGAVSVRYATVDGTARAGVDYTVRSGTLSWAAGDATTRTIKVPVSTASPFSGTRSFSLKLSSPAGGATLGTPAMASVTIRGSAAGVFKLSAGSYSVSQSGGAVRITVNRAGGSVGAVTVSFATLDGTARAGVDYTARSGKLSWADGDAAPKTFRVLVSNATPFLNSRTFTVKLSAPTGGALMGSPASATVTINGSKVAYAQPYITSWGPISGPVGTVVTINGTGFDGIDQAWAGAAHDAVVTVVSDTQVKVKTPADATTGAIGILNPTYAAFTPSSFTVTR